MFYWYFLFRPLILLSTEVLQDSYGLYLKSIPKDTISDKDEEIVYIVDKKIIITLFFRRK